MVKSVTNNWKYKVQNWYREIDYIYFSMRTNRWLRLKHSKFLKFKVSGGFWIESLYLDFATLIWHRCSLFHWNWLSKLLISQQQLQFAFNLLKNESKDEISTYFQQKCNMFLIQLLVYNNRPIQPKNYCCHCQVLDGLRDNQTKTIIHTFLEFNILSSNSFNYYYYYQYYYFSVRSVITVRISCMASAGGFIGVKSPAS